MKCDSCKEHDATVRITEVVGNNKRVYYSCESCANLDQMIDPERLLAESGLAKIADQSPLDLQQEQALPDPLADECPACGITWQEIKSKGRFGCPEDYTAFSGEVASLLESIHGTSAHAGRGPERMLAILARRREETRLRQELAEAVRAEDFEKAARVRDALRTFEDEGKPPRERP